MVMTYIALFLALTVLLLFSWARVQEGRVLFFPTAHLHTNPADRDLDYQDVRFSSEGRKLHGWYIPAPGSQVVLWLHGNAGNIADRVDQAAAMREQLGVSSFLIDYRGYGWSEGRPSERGLYEDAAAAFRWLTGVKGFDPASIVLYGHSLGSAVSVDLALGEGRGAGGMVLESPFTSAREVARLIYHGLPVDLFLSVKLDNIGRVGCVSMPLLVVHGLEDTTIPFSMGKAVFAAAAEPKTFLPVSGGGHSDGYLVGGREYWNAWKEFLEQIEAGRRTRAEDSGPRKR